MMRIGLSWTFYWLGGLAYRLDWGWGYQRFMEWAYRLQGEDERGPWHVCEPGD